MSKDLPTISQRGNSSAISTPSRTWPWGARGFTLVEIIAVLVLLGVMSAIVLNHANNSGVDAELSGAAEVVKGHLRFAQTKAMNADLSWGLNFTGTTYDLQDANGVTAPLPSVPPEGMTFTATVNPVMFERRWGSPGGATITVTVAKGGASRTITVTRKTGFIP